MIATLFSLYWHFTQLSLMAIGGTSTTLPEMHRYLVIEQGWLTQQQFLASYTLSQVAPGPNLLFVSLFGWQVAGALGAIVSMVGICTPSSLLALLTAHYANSDPMWLRLFKQGLAPVTTGLTLSTGWILADNTSPHYLVAYLITGVTVLLFLWKRIHPLWFIGAGALIGAMGWI